MKAKQAVIGVCGLWHLGCVLCAAWTKLGYRVIGYDPEKDRVGKLRRGQPPLFEPDLEPTLLAGLSGKRLRFTDAIGDLRECDFVFVAFDTPVSDDDECDLSPLEQAVAGLSRTVKDGATIIVSSQTPVGTCAGFRAQLRHANPQAELVYSPENLRLGQAIECYLNPGRIILGAESDAATKRAVGLFDAIDAQIIAMNLASAEMVKHAINSFLANSIVFANHLADLCEVCGANILDVVAGMKSEDRIGQKAYLAPGIGFSGGTLGRDLRVLSGLAAEGGGKATIYGAIIEFNAERKRVIVDRVVRLLGGQPRDKTVAILGLTYKPGTSTLRRSLPLEIAQLLVRTGACVRSYDPHADYKELEVAPEFEICSSMDDALRGSDLAVLLTEWPEFREYDWEAGGRLMRRRRVFDAKNFLVQAQLAAKGFQYSGVGLDKVREHDVT